MGTHISRGGDPRGSGSGDKGIRYHGIRYLRLVATEGVE
jgi:hypothetical protein